MDVLVMLEELQEKSSVLAQVNSAPSTVATEHLTRDVVTLFGVPNAESLALALAAALESSRTDTPAEYQTEVTRNVGVWPERGAVGDAAWRDHATGEVVKREVDIPLAVLIETATQLLAECGQGIRRLLAGLLMPDWPEGTSRAIAFSFAPVAGGANLFGESFLDTLREADGLETDEDDN
ncbi:MAG TPA: hypothetical protein VGI97_10080 [Gemmatimonadaceae bacterium]|jgi:hypothetical protein